MARAAAPIFKGLRGETKTTRRLERAASMRGFYSNCATHLAVTADLKRVTLCPQK
jgi:hypothetical protein